MSSNHFYPDWKEKVTVPIKRVGDRWEFFYGGDVPAKDGAMGELTIEADDITDERFRQRVSAEITVQILEEGTPLLVALSDRSGNNLKGDWPDKHPLDLPLGTTRLERVWLGPPKAKYSASLQQELNDIPEKGGLWLRLRGLEKTELLSSTVRMPSAVSKEFANSLNHAFTLLSQTYERHRISNTGNVYTRVFYQEKDGQWYPLDDLRKGVQVSKERELLHQLWADVEQKLGWRPTPQVQKPNKKKR